MFLFGLLIGCYAMIAILFCVCLAFLCCLGGKSSDLWKPIIYPIVWPISLPLFIMGIIK